MVDWSGLVAGKFNLSMLDRNARLKYDDDFPQTEMIRVTLWFDIWSVSAARQWCCCVASGFVFAWAFISFLLTGWTAEVDLICWNGGIIRGYVDRRPAVCASNPDKKQVGGKWAPVKLPQSFVKQHFYFDTSYDPALFVPLQCIRLELPVVIHFLFHSFPEQLLWNAAPFWL